MILITTMEDTLYTEATAKLKAAKAVAYITDAGLPALATIDWWEDQIGEALKAEGNESMPFNMPALFFEFSPTKYTKRGSTEIGSGELTLHLAQDKLGKDGRDGAETLTDFKDLLGYAALLVDILTEEKLPCSAMLVLSQIERDHTNSPVMHERITFTWTARYRRSAVPAIP